MKEWSAASRQNTLAAALKEWGMLRRTVHLAKYLSDPAFGRKISRQLNKGESLHSLRRDLHYAQQGTITRPHLEQQTEQAWCLTLLTNSVVAWTTEYYSRAVLELRSQGREVSDEILSHISPGPQRQHQLLRRRQRGRGGGAGQARYQRMASAAAGAAARAGADALSVPGPHHEQV